MKNTFKKLALLLFLNFSITQINAQSLGQTLTYADSLYDSKNYQAAIKEYSRVHYFSGNRFSVHLYNRLAWSYFYLSKYQQAAQYFDLEYFSLQNDSAQNEAVYNKAACFILSKNYLQALSELYSLEDKKLSDFFRRKKQFYLGVSYWGMENFEKSEACFLAAIPKDQKEIKTQITTIFHTKSNFNRPHIGYIRAMSAIIPGSGQLILGDWRSGINSFILTNGLLALGVVVANKYTVLDAFLSVFPWFQRYYQGGLVKVANSAKLKKAKNRNITYQKIIDLIDKANK